MWDRPTGPHWCYASYREQVCACMWVGGCMSAGGRELFYFILFIYFGTKSVHLQYFCNMSWKTCHQNNRYYVPKISMQFFRGHEYGVLCTCKIILPTILEETINSHHYLWIILAPFFKEFKEGKNVLLLDAG
jgi:hypothetical protein